jgi:phosphate/sulfate permease
MVVSFVTATLLIAASLLGIPQSLVQLNIFSLFAVSCLKNGHKNTFELHVTKKTFGIWIITPLLAAAISYILLFTADRVF